MMSQRQDKMSGSVAVCQHGRITGRCACGRLLLVAGWPGGRLVGPGGRWPVVAVAGWPWPAGRLAGWPAGQVAGWPGGRLAGGGRLWPVVAGCGRVAGWPAGRLAGCGRLWPVVAGCGRLWPAGRLAGWPAGRLAGWPWPGGGRDGRQRKKLLWSLPCCHPQLRLEHYSRCCAAVHCRPCRHWY